MKIKQTRQVRLDELLKLFWNNEIKDGEYPTNDFGSVILEKNRLIFDNRNHIEKSDLFTITEEVEITEESPLDIVVIDDYKVSFSAPDISIREAIEMYISAKFIYLQNDDGSIGELIWDKERGLID